MAKYLVKDLKKVTQPAILNLKATEDVTLFSKQKPTAPFLDLSLNHSQDRQPYYTKSSFSAKSQKNLESIHSLQPRESYFYVPETKITNSTVSNHFFGLLRFAALGLLIAFSLNIINVLQNGTALRSTLVGSAMAGFNEIMDGSLAVQSSDYQLAQNNFGQAKQNFDQALEKISFLQAAQNAFLSSENTSASVNHLLLAGQSLSEAGNLFSEAATDLQNLPALFIQYNQDFLAKQKPTTPGTPVQLTTPDAKNTPSLTDALKIDLEKVNQAILLLQDTEKHLDQIDLNLLPEKYRTELPALKQKLSKLNSFLEQLRVNFPAILKLLGDRYPHRYAILLQNDTESRPTGGFIGSLIIMDINDGHISRFDFHDVYQYDGQFYQKITPPEDIAKVTDAWYLRDSNYSPDFAISAEKAAWFLQAGKGPSVDTVIAVNQSLMADLLSLTGPIDVPELKSELTADNFQFVLSYLIESKYYGSTQPKIILEKTIQAFQKKLLSLTNWTDFFKLLAKEIVDQKIMFYSRDAQVQSFFELFNLTPHQAQIGEKEDYLQVIASSIGGNKSDAFIKQNLNHLTIVSQDGTINDELTITRSHTWNSLDLTKWQKIIDQFGFNGMSDDLINLLGRGNNKVILKVYVPLGTELENVVGLEPAAVSLRSDSDLQKSYFIFTMETVAGEASQVTLRYKLPYQLQLLPADIYRFTAQKQAGLVPTTIRQETKIDPEIAILKDTAAGSETKLENNFHYSAVISR